MRGKTPMPFILNLYGLWIKVSLKQTCKSLLLLINKHLEEPRLRVAFYHDFKHFVQHSVN